MYDDEERDFGPFIMVYYVVCNADTLDKYYCYYYYYYYSLFLPSTTSTENFGWLHYQTTFEHDLLSISLLVSKAYVGLDFGYSLVINYREKFFLNACLFSTMTRVLPGTNEQE